MSNSLITTFGAVLCICMIVIIGMQHGLPTVLVGGTIGLLIPYLSIKLVRAIINLASNHRSNNEDN